MNYPSMNAIRASKAATGLAGGTQRPAPQPMPTMGGSLAIGRPVQQGPAAPTPMSSNQTMNPQYPWAGSGTVNVSGPQYAEYGGKQDAQQQLANSFIGRNDAQGVSTALGTQPAMQGPAPVQFDPNDPNNAALAGYMAGPGNGMMGT